MPTARLISADSALERLKAIIATLFVVTIGTSVAYAQDLYVSSDRTVANGMPINGTFGSVQVGRDSSANNYGGIHADFIGGTYSGDISSYNTSFVNVTGGDYKSDIMAQNSSTLMFGGTAKAETFLSSFDTATVSVTGGTIKMLQSGSFQGSDSPTVNFGGTAQATQLNADANSITNITGGNFGVSSGFLTVGGVSAENTATVNVFGGTNLGGIDASDTSHINVSGGTIENGISTSNSSVLKITGGTITSGINVYDDSTLNFGGTASVDAIFGNGNNNINISGGTVGLVVGPFSGVMSISGGSITSDIQGWGSVVNISGGQVTQSVLANVGASFGDFSTFNLIGSGLTLSNGTAGIYDDGFGDSLNGIYWNLNGRLQDGTLLNTQYFDYAGSLSGPANINGAVVGSAAAPEPPCLSLLSLPILLGLLAMRLRVHSAGSAASATA